MPEEFDSRAAEQAYRNQKGDPRAIHHLQHFFNISLALCLYLRVHSHILDVQYHNAGSLQQSEILNLCTKARERGTHQVATLWMIHTCTFLL